MEEQQVLIQKPKPWLVDIDKKLHEFPGAAAELEHWKKRSIYKIPAASVTDLKQRAYTPQIVSIGPYHYGAEHLKAMEEHKCRALLHFLKRSNKSLEILVEALAPAVQVLKDAYDQLDPKWNKDDDKFLEVMITDGCFILEILRTTKQQQQSGGADQSSNDQDYATNDPIFSHHGNLYIIPYLKRDMLMLENQIPILVLEKLVSIQNNASLKKREELTKLILEFFFPTVSNEHLNNFNECLHILCVYRKSMLLKPLHQQTKDGKHGNIKPGGEGIIRSATELSEAGIKIKPSETESLKDISFQKGILRGTLRLPFIVVDDALESLYLNLIAFERFHAGAGNEVTSYIFFMDNIIDNERDVILLHQCKIIQNALGSDKAVAKLFNTLSKDITLDPASILNVVRKNVTEYCQKPWHKWQANLWHTYFTNPWAFISFIAAIFLFALTILQSVYGVLSYIKQSSPSSG